MSVRARVWAFALSLALLAVAAFVVSFAAGIGRRENVRPAVDAASNTPADGAAASFATGARQRLLELERRIRVEVLNAAGRQGIAEAATEQLRDSGFDVVYFGNAPAFNRDSSAVLARRGGLESARAVADALGITAVWSAPDSTLLVDVSVLLGTDWPRPQNDAQGGWAGHRRVPGRGSRHRRRAARSSQAGRPS